jgi:hypothetical protein
MTLNRLHFREALGSMQPWNCPRCTTGTLKELPNEQVEVQPHYSKVEQREDWWEPEHGELRFSAQMRCTNSSCGECVFVIGRAVTRYYGEDEEGPNYGQEFEPRATFPPIPVFRLSNDWPGPVIAELRRSFAAI